MEKEDFIINEEDLEISPYDIAEFLTTEEDFKTHIEIYFEEEGIKGLQKALANVARAKLVNELVKKTGSSRKVIIKALHEEKNSYNTNHKTNEIFEKILEAFKIKTNFNKVLIS